jgi:predicted amidohydrolase
VYVANWPERRAAHWRALLQARAIENQAYVAGVNRVGVDGNGLAYSGDSSLFDPMGVALATGAVREQALVVELDAAVLADYRQKFPAWMDADRFRLED